jgi:hypothetical protein
MFVKNSASTPRRGTRPTNDDTAGYLTLAPSSLAPRWFRYRNLHQGRPKFTVQQLQETMLRRDTGVQKRTIGQGGRPDRFRAGVVDFEREQKLALSWFGRSSWVAFGPSCRTRPTGRLWHGLAAVSLSSSAVCGRRSNSLFRSRTQNPLHPQPCQWLLAVWGRAGTSVTARSTPGVDRSAREPSR